MDPMFFTTPEVGDALRREATEGPSGLGVILDIRLEKLPRQKCFVCKRRRVGFRLSVDDIGVKLAGPIVCAEHAGIR